MTPNPPPRHGNQRGSVSVHGPATEKLLAALSRTTCHVRFARAHGARATCAPCASFLAWLARPRRRARGRADRGPRRVPEPTLCARGRRTARPTRSATRRTGSSARQEPLPLPLPARLPAHDPAAPARVPAAREAPAARHPDARGGAQASSRRPTRTTPLGLRDRAILETFYATGIRASELAQLTLDDVDTEERLAARRARQGAQGPQRPAHARRRRGDRGVPRSTAGRSSAAREDRRWLFLAHRGGRMHRRPLERSSSSAAAKKAGIKKHVTCHTFRHRVATHLLKGGADIRHIQALLGHTLARDDRALHARRDLGPHGGPEPCASARPVEGARGRSTRAPSRTALQALLDELRVRWYSKPLQKQARNVLAALLLPPKGQGASGTCAPSPRRTSSPTRATSPSRRPARGRATPLATQRSYLALVQRLFRFLDREGVILQDPTLDLVLPTWKKLPRAVLNQAQARRLVASPDHAHAARQARPRDPRAALRHRDPRRRVRAARPAGPRPRAGPALRPGRQGKEGPRRARRRPRRGRARRLPQGRPARAGPGPARAGALPHDAAARGST